MPIIRRGEEQDPLDKHVYTLWYHKWLIMGIAIIAGVLTYIGLLFVNETFRVKAEIFVNRLPTANDQETPNPETVTSLLKSQAVLEKVRNDYVQAFDVSRVPKIEAFTRQFEVKSVILQDTTVQKQYSPVLSLQVDSVGTSETRYIMDSWIRNFIEEFGNYTTLEAVGKRDAYLKEKSKVEKEIADLEIKRAMYDSQLPYLKRSLAENLDVLTPSQLQFQEDDADTIKMDLKLQNPRMRPGLLERYSELQLQVQGGNTPSTAGLELAALSTAIREARTSVSLAEKELAQVRMLQLQAIRQLTQLTDVQKAVNEAVSRFTVAAAVYKQTFVEGLPAGGDIRALTSPIMPETKIWPKRTLVAGLVAVAAAILTGFWVLARNFLTKLSVKERQ